MGIVISTSHQMMVMRCVMIIRKRIEKRGTFQNLLLYDCNHHHEKKDRNKKIWSGIIRSVTSNSKLDIIVTFPHDSLWFKERNQKFCNQMMTQKEMMLFHVWKHVKQDVIWSKHQWFRKIISTSHREISSSQSNSSFRQLHQVSSKWSHSCSSLWSSYSSLLLARLTQSQIFNKYY